MLRVVIVFVMQLLLWALFSAINHYSALWQLHLYTGALFVLYPGLKMGPREGIVVCALSGLLFDAHNAGGFGHSLFLHVLAFMVLLHTRIRLARDESSVQSAVAVVLNITLQLASWFLCLLSSGGAGLLWSRLFWELLFSSIFVGLVAPWSVSLQWNALSLMEQDRFRRREDE